MKTNFEDCFTNRMDWDIDVEIQAVLVHVFPGEVWEVAPDVAELPAGLKTGLRQWRHFLDTIPWQRRQWLLQHRHQHRQYRQGRRHTRTVQPTITRGRASVGRWNRLIGEGNEGFRPSSEFCWDCPRQLYSVSTQPPSFGQERKVLRISGLSHTPAD